jgi:predicted AAA+ superfamily ATPase
MNIEELKAIITAQKEDVESLFEREPIINRDIDTIIQQLIQVTYASAKNEIDQRELESFRAAATELNCENMLVITWDYEATTLVNDKTVIFTPLWKWLLIDNS